MTEQRALKQLAPNVWRAPASRTPRPTATWWGRRSTVNHSAAAFAVARLRLRLAECLTWAHGAEGATRLVYADFLAETGRAETASLARQAGAQWSGIADVAAGSAVPSTSITELADGAASVYDIELTLADALTNERTHA